MSYPLFNLKDKNMFFAAAPVYLSFPHFYQADAELLDAVVGLKPVPELHGTYFKIQPVNIC